MNIPCQNLTISKVTSNDIGTKFVKIKIHVPVLTMMSENKLLVWASEMKAISIGAAKLFESNVPKSAPMNASNI